MPCSNSRRPSLFMDVWLSSFTDMINFIFFYRKMWILFLKSNNSAQIYLSTIMKTLYGVLTSFRFRRQLLMYVDRREKQVSAHVKLANLCTTPQFYFYIIPIPSCFVLPTFNCEMHSWETLCLLERNCFTDAWITSEFHSLINDIFSHSKLQ